MKRVNLLTSKTTIDGDILRKQFDNFDFKVTYKDFKLFNEKVSLFGVMLFLSRYNCSNRKTIPVDSLGMKTIKKEGGECYTSVYIPVRLFGYQT